MASNSLRGELLAATNGKKSNVKKSNETKPLEYRVLELMLDMSWRNTGQIKQCLNLTPEELPVLRNILNKMAVHRGAFEKHHNGNVGYRLKRLIYSGGTARDWLECEHQFGFKPALGTETEPGLITTNGWAFCVTGLIFTKEDLRSIYIELTACGFSPKSIPVSGKMRYVKLNPTIGDLTFQESVVIRLMAEIAEILRN